MSSRSGRDETALDAFAARLRRKRRRCSSIFGDAEQVLGLWARLEKHWGDARSVRPDQPMMAVSAVPAKGSGPVDARVRRARLDEVDQVLPASTAMFTEEIGYPPFVGSDRDYRRMVTSLVSAGHTFIVTEGHDVVFKADVGSLAAGVAQLQGVWVAPTHRGKGLATPAMRAVVRQVIETIAPTVTLYVNAYNEPALRTYHAAGFRQVGRFATVILYVDLTGSADGFLPDPDGQDPRRGVRHVRCHPPRPSTDVRPEYAERGATPGRRRPRLRRGRAGVRCRTSRPGTRRVAGRAAAALLVVCSRPTCR